jgi:hypothetical protein
MPPARIAQKKNDYNILRDGGMSYGDYVEQLTYRQKQHVLQERQTILEYK